MKATVVVVGLGPAGPELMSAAATEAIAALSPRWLRTTRHPAASAVPAASSFDAIYDSADSLEDVYRRIVEDLVAAALEHGRVLYAVPGSPLVAESTVELLRGEDRIALQIVPSMSFLDLAWARLGVDPLAVGARLVDGRRFAVEAAAERGPLLVGQCDTREVLSDIKLAVGEDLDPRTPVTVLQRLGLSDEAVFDVPWDQLDRHVAPDHLSSLWIPTLSSPVGQELARLDELVRTLRARCPWDREQTHATLTRHLLEETYEVLDAIDGLGRPGGGGAAHLEEELGDLLFQVVFHARLGAEAGEFNLADVARGVHDKLVARHPHVFGTVEAETADAVMRNWEQIKRAEKGRASVMDGIPASLPALLLAQKVQRKAASLGIDLPGPPSGAPDTPEELGAALFALVGRARIAGIDAEEALRTTARAFRERVRAAEGAAPGSGS
ncbi:MAG: MazG family protein [Acidimicrobiales bacterium]